MFQTFWQKFKIVLQDSGLRKRIGFIFFILLLFRVGAAIPVPGVDLLRLEAFLSGNQFFGLLNIFSGGGLSNLSIVMLGLGPYITGSIIMQLATIMSSKLKALYHEEGEAGRRRFNQYSRMLTVPLAVTQGFGLLTLLERSNVLSYANFFDKSLDIIVVTAGAVLLMWLGEIISEKGIGNGVSILIFAGIVASLPTTISRLIATFDPSQIPIYIGFFVAAIVIVGGVVFITEAERPIPITYAKRVRGNKVYGGVSTYLPLRVNQAGVIPIIFALSLLLFPQMIVSFLANVNNAIIQTVSSIILAILQNPWIYGGLYFILVFLFTYFYTAITFDPDAISQNLQRGGAFIPGVRPGVHTAEHIGSILNRITLFGALFLGIIAVLPIVMQGITGLTSLAIGGTALLIVVSVVLDLMKKVDAQITMREY
ncbi:MAG: preprotein translocase subunit SecY [Candidatus Lloydbacteria bacterium CG22_combo_CG10-13_8_21_14_all_47_15]|uniref:Protein translocase subunit SecY n=1 Tax=Candidatus Lloydbacteria bacterium CG22_combo_CG10-13_8_21_14_all_47_15 TaxID=1974635 RepID=A0A2H0CTP8_9BACT|nr:MAG: preprotein translocase subunit SecY [Candidatus Lloydbacteria bacterium CG22_combo_CG10-13_8_21_14_all_47_15]